MLMLLWERSALNTESERPSEWNSRRRYVKQHFILPYLTVTFFKPKLLLFLDEPTSGLDSESAWAIVNFLRELADHGQAILCT
jgi:ABC-type hemin transport system ATPase subunit